MPHFCSLPWTPFRECWKSAAVSVLDLILVEVYGKCQFVVYMLNLSFFFFKRFLFPLSFGNLNVSCHGGRPWIAALRFSCMFTGEISGSLFVSGQHCSGPHRDQTRFPTALGLVCKQVKYPLLSPLLITVLPTNSGEWRCVFILELSFHPLCIWSTLALFGIYLNVLTFWLICGSLGY